MAKIGLLTWWVFTETVTYRNTLSGHIRENEVIVELYCIFAIHSNTLFSSKQLSANHHMCSIGSGIKLTSSWSISLLKRFCFATIYCYTCVSLSDIWQPLVLKLYTKQCIWCLYKLLDTLPLTLIIITTSW